MNKFPLLSILTLLIYMPFELNSQSYDPMAVEGATWVMTGYGEFHYIAWAFKIEGDSLLNDTLYKKLNYYDLEVIDDDFSWPKEYKINSVRFAGLMRDDVENRKVYFRSLDIILNKQELVYECKLPFIFIDKEQLLFDFDKTVGDTLTDCMLLPEEDIDMEIKKDTTWFEYDKNRRILSIDEFEDSYQYLIEGIGYRSGLFNEAQLFIHAAKGIGLDYYCIGDMDDCKLNTSIKEYFLEDEISIYPNPVRDRLFIESEAQPERIEIINSFGIRLLSIGWNHNSKTQEMDLSELGPGIFFVKTLFKDQESSLAKFVKL